MSWEPGRPLLRKENGRWRQASRVETAEASAIFMTYQDERKLDDWMYKKKLAIPKSTWNQKSRKLKKKGGENSHVK